MSTPVDPSPMIQNATGPLAAAEPALAALDRDQKTKREREGPRLRGPWRGSLRIVVVVVLLLILTLSFLIVGKEITAPTWIRERVETAAAEAMGGGALRFGAITLALPGDLHPRVRLLDVTISDKEGRLLVRIPEATIQVSPRGLLFSRSLLVQEIALTGAQLTLARAADGSVEVAFGSGGQGQSVSRVDGLASLPDQFERLFERPALAALRTVRVNNLVVNYQDARAGRVWTVDGGTFSLDLVDGRTHLRGEVSVLSGRSYVTRARLDYESPRLSKAARISLTLTDVAASDVASQSPALTWLRVVDAPISMALRVQIDETGSLGPTNVALKIAEGRLRPHPNASAVGFDLARAYLSYDPLTQAVRFDTVEVRSDWGSVLAEGRAYLKEIEAGLPRALLGQFTFRDIAISPPGVYEEAAHLPEATVQFRLRLDPFSVEIAEASLGLPGEGLARLDVSGQVAASPDGWRIALDARLAELAREGLLALWPERFRPGLRAWIAENVTDGVLHDVAAALRIEPEVETEVAVTSNFSGLAVRPLGTHPPIVAGEGRMGWEDNSFSVALDSGHVDAPEGGSVDMAGTAFVIAPGDGARSPARVHVDAAGPITATLSLLDQPPYRFLSSADLPVDLADGTARTRGTVDLFLGPMRPDELRYDIAATLSDVRSDLLIPGRMLTAESLEATVTPAGLEIAGDMQVGTAQVQGRWTQGFGPDEKGQSRVEARVEISPRVLDELGIVLPDGSVSGDGAGDLTVDLREGQPPAFALRSDLEGLALALPQMSWSKPAARTGNLVVEGRLGTPARIDRLSLSAPGLSAEGDLRLTEAGSFDRLSLSRLTVADWFEAPVTLIAQFGSDTPAVEVRGGQIDLGRAAFGSGGQGDGGPISVTLDRLQVTDSIALTGFAGEFSTVSGLEGVFSGQVNGGPTVTGRVAPQGGRVAARIQGSDAGAVMTAANLFTKAEGGDLDLLLLPEGPASYMGELWIEGLKVRDAPVLASLLNAASGIGLLQQLAGQGIVFDEVGAKFRVDPTLVILEQSSARGAGLGLSMDGVFDTENYFMDFRGVVSPFYLVNGIGSILSRPGEGLLGFNFTLRGDPDDPTVGVNPLSVLAPGRLRELFRRRPSLPEQ
ncbi:DUF3971 domain-containing protein [Rubellimicrobium rubrum]|uniref:DUF3971 domain-containing protein n=1 Tax=Rubellimicrobium rubrum TaxID=2585369 RepID=A0A5C4N1G6_9RHOB|nr:DUF3971 domain-containing protein [Rubellimicrobium rubrum]TNC50787.1 DUF3971 domain-containing protein [Rubellimicrobium rubrum]